MNTKKEIRISMLEKRSLLSKNEMITKSNAIANHLYNTTFYNNSNFIMTYIDFRKEVITKDIIEYSLKKGKHICVPITIPKTRELMVSEIKNFEKELELGCYNILTPKKEYIRKIDPKTLDLILVPGAAFDKNGYRIGYGGGYYDRFFNKLCHNTLKIGLAYQMQIINNIPNDTYDKPVDYIITENGLIKCIDKNI